MYLFDTDILSDLMKRTPSPELQAKLRSVPAEEQFTSSITLGELIHGARKKGSEKLLREVRRIVANLQILPFDASAADVYGKVRAELEAAGSQIGEADTRIAAIALDHGIDRGHRKCQAFRSSCYGICRWKTGVDSVISCTRPEGDPRQSPTGDHGRARDRANDSASGYQRSDDGFHNWRADPVSEKPDAVTARTGRQIEILVETHGSLELRHLKHPHSVVRTPSVSNQGKAIQRRDRA